MKQVPILLVEDDTGSVFFFQHVAEKIGMTNPLHVATDGQEALNYLEGIGEFADRHKFPLPGLVLLDLKLPRASGFDVLRRIRASANLRKLIVIMLTASASDNDVQEAYALGANAYLVKPLQLEHLEAIARTIKDFWLTHNHPPQA